MFIFTAKFDRQKIIGVVLAIVVLLAAVFILKSDKNSDTEAFSYSQVVKNNDERVSFLESLGWDVDSSPIEEQEVLIPKDFNEVYQEYNQLQVSQGFDLTDYSGLEAVRYTYKVLNHPTCSEDVVADIIVYRNRVIAGDIQSVSMDGFMAGLSYPN
jgi:hypothetical protein